MGEAQNVSSMPNALLALLELERGWDSYDGMPVDKLTAHKAASIGIALAGHFTSPASYVPLSSGDIQIEWHCDGWDVEIAVERVR